MFFSVNSSVYKTRRTVGVALAFGSVASDRLKFSSEQLLTSIVLPGTTLIYSSIFALTLRVLNTNHNKLDSLFGGRKQIWTRKQCSAASGTPYNILLLNNRLQ